MNQSDDTIPTLRAHEKLALQQPSSVFYALIEELQKPYTTPLLLTRKNDIIFVAACTGIKEQPGYRLLEVVSLKKQKGATVGKPMAPPGSIKKYNLDVAKDTAANKKKNATVWEPLGPTGRDKI